MVFFLFIVYFFLFIFLFPPIFQYIRTCTFFFFFFCCCFVFCIYSPPSCYIHQLLGYTCLYKSICIYIHSFFLADMLKPVSYLCCDAGGSSWPLKGNTRICHSNVIRKDILNYRKKKCGFKMDVFFCEMFSAWKNSQKKDGWAEKKMKRRIGSCRSRNRKTNI